MDLKWDKRHNNVTCTWKKVKFGLILVRTETDVTTHTCKFLSRNKNKNSTLGYQYSSFVNFCKIKVCPKTWTYFNMKSGWLKTSARTNMGPQNNTRTYLYAPKEFKMIEISNTYIDGIKITLCKKFSLLP